MKQQETKENTITGWANENQINQDAIVLTNILQRKSKVRPLPQINSAKVKEQIINIKHFSKSKLGYTMDKIHHQNIKAERGKSENDEYEVSDSTGFFKPRRFIAITEEKEQESFVSPLLNNRKNTQQVKPQHFQQGGLSPFDRYQKEDERKDVFSKTMKLHKHTTRSHEFIIHKITSKFGKIHSKVSLKANNFDMGHVRVNKSRRNIDGQECLSEERQLLVSKNRKNDSRMEVDCQKTTKLKNIFTKRNKAVKNKSFVTDQEQFSDQVIFSNNSIVVNKQFANNPYLQSKIQIIKHPKRYPNILNK